MTSPTGLSASLAQLKASVKLKLIGTPPEYTSGLIYKAAYEAYKTAGKYDELDSMMNNMNNAISDEDWRDNRECPAKKELENNSKTFAKVFCEQLDPDFTDIILESIDTHIKNAIFDITLTIPGPNGALTGVMGPVTGSVLANNLSASGGISVS